MDNKWNENLLLYFSATVIFKKRHVSYSIFKMLVILFSFKNINISNDCSNLFLGKA